MVSISKLARNIFRNGPHFLPSPEAEAPQESLLRDLTQQACREPSFTGPVLTLQVYDPSNRDHLNTEGLLSRVLTENSLAGCSKATLDS